MKYNLTQLASNKVREVEINDQMLIDDNDHMTKHDNFKVAPINLNGTIGSLGKNFYLNLKYSSTWRFLCSRCLAETEFVIEGRIEKSIVKDGNDEDEDIIVVESSIIDLYDLIYNDIVLNLPTKVMCDEECKGLCPDCGVNLNHETCECTQETIDPRLEKLKNFFTQN